MNLHFSTLFSLAYFKALSIVKDEQPKLWSYFSKEVSIFSAVSNCYIAGILAHHSSRKEIKENQLIYRRYWEKDGEVIQERLQSLFGLKLKKKRITAYICITPLYIRNIERGFFLLPIGAEKERILNIIVHELSHFYCYQGYEMYGYEENNAWEISEYLVKYIMEAHFGDLCQRETSSYLGDVPERYEKHILCWVNQKCTFEELLTRIKGEK